MNKMRQVNRVAEGLLKQLIEAGNDYQKEIFAAVDEYDAGMESIQKTANQRYAVKKRTNPSFTVQRDLDKENEEEERFLSRLRGEYVQEKQAILTAEARKRIRAAQDVFQTSARETAKSLESQLQDAAFEPISSGFLRLAETLSKFNLAPNRLELDTLVSLAEENMTAIRVIDGLLKQTNAPFVLHYKDADDFVGDLELLKQLATDDYFCSPVAVHHQMCEIFRDQKISRDEESISFKRGETFNSVSLLICSQSFGMAMGKLEAMIPSWGAGVRFEAADALSREMEQQERDVADLLEREPELPDYKSPTQVQESGEDGTALAVELGREAAAAKAPVSESLGDLVK